MNPTERVKASDISGACLADDLLLGLIRAVREPLPEEENHLEDCSSCRASYNQLVAVWVAFEEADLAHQAHLNDDLDDELDAALRDELSGERLEVLKGQLQACGWCQTHARRVAACLRAGGLTIAEDLLTEWQPVVTKDMAKKAVAETLQQVGRADGPSNVNLAPQPGPGPTPPSAATSAFKTQSETDTPRITPSAHSGPIHPKWRGIMRAASYLSAVLLGALLGKTVWNASNTAPDPVLSVLTLEDFQGLHPPIMSYNVSLSDALEVGSERSGVGKEQLTVTHFKLRLFLPSNSGAGPAEDGWIDADSEATCKPQSLVQFRYTLNGSGVLTLFHTKPDGSVEILHSDRAPFSKVAQRWPNETPGPQDRMGRLFDEPTEQGVHTFVLSFTTEDPPKDSVLAWLESIKADPKKGVVSTLSCTVTRQ